MRRLALVLVPLAACGPTWEGAALAEVNWERWSAGPDCVRVSMTDLASMLRDPLKFEELRFPLVDAGLSGTLKVGLARPKGWSATVRVGASLHLASCDAEPDALETQDHTFKDNEKKTLRFFLVPGRDAGADAGADAGMTDAGAPDAGTPDGGTDSGTPDAGTPDAGTPDAGTPDAGAVPDAGPFDAGPNCPNAAVRAVRGLAGGQMWKDLKPYNAGTAIVVGENDALALVNSAGTLTSWGGGTCLGSFYGVWLRGDGQPFAVGTTGGIVEVNGSGSCRAAFPISNGTPTSLTGYDLPDGGARFFVGTRGQAGVVDTTSGSATARTVPGAGAVWDVAALDEQTVFAVGETSNGSKGAIWRWSAGTQTWGSASELTGGNTPFYAVSVVTPAVAFAGGVNFVEFDGAGWATRTAPAFTIFGLKAFSRSSVYAVGYSSGAIASFAHWDGTSWASPTRPMPASSLMAIDGTDGCQLWGAGDDGFIVSNLP